MLFTPIYNLPYPELDDDANAPENLQALAGALETALATTTVGPKFRVYRSAAQAGIVTGTPTKVQFNAETFDADTLFDAVTNFRLQPDVPGKWQLQARVSISLLGAGQVLQVSLYKNGAAVAVSPVSNGTANPYDLSAGVADILSFNGTSDYAEVFVQHSHGSNRSTMGGTLNDFFCGHYLGA